MIKNERFEQQTWGFERNGELEEGRKREYFEQFTVCDAAAFSPVLLLLLFAMAESEKKRKSEAFFVRERANECAFYKQANSHEH